MKKFFSSLFGKRLLIGIGMIAAAVALGFAEKDLFNTDVMLHRAVYIIGVFGTGLAAFFYILVDWRGLLMGYGLILFQVLSLMLPEPWNRYVVVLSFLAFFSWPVAARYLQHKKKKRSAPEPSPESADFPEQNAQEASPAAQPGRGPIIVQRRSNGAFYQALLRDGTFLFYRLGSVWQEIDESKLIDGDDTPPLGKHDFAIAASEVTKMRVHELTQENTLFDLNINLYVQNKRYALGAIQAAGGANLLRLLNEQVPEDAKKKRRPESYRAPSPKHKRLILLKKVYFGICAFALLVDLAWLFLDVPYELFAWLALLPVPALLMMYYLYPNEVTLSDSGKAAYGRITAVGPLLMTAMIPVLRVMLDFNILSVGRWMLVAGIVTALLVVQAYFTSQEFRKRKLVLLSIAFALAIYSIGLTGELNYLLDGGPAQELPAVVQKMHISSGSKSPDRYILSITTQDRQSYDMQVVKEFYLQTEVGDEVEVFFFQGALGIKYAEIDQTP